MAKKKSVPKKSAKKKHGPAPLDRVIITAALTGALADRKQCPEIPYTPKEIAEEALRAYEAGATLVHIHARENDGKPTWRPEVFAEIAKEIRSRCPILLNFSTGGVGNTIQERAQSLPLVKPDMAALNMGSMNYSIYSPRQKKFLLKTVFLNPFDEIEWLLGVMNENGIVPEMECFDAGHICNTAPFIDMGMLKPPFHFSLILGVVGGISASPHSLKAMVGLLPKGAEWQLIGISQEQWSMMPLSLELGGHVRVGLEDNLYLPNGKMAHSNAELVEAAVKLIKKRGQKVANLDETRRIITDR